MPQVLGRPCGPCPWVRANADRLCYPNLAAYAQDTIPELGFGPPTDDDPLAPLGTLFACHHDTQNRLCAGHVATVGHAHPLIRLALIWRLLDPAVLTPGEDWPELFDDYQQMVDTVGHVQPATTIDPAATQEPPQSPRTLR